MAEINLEDDENEKLAPSVEKVEGPTAVKVTSGTKAEHIYDKHQKLVYLFDVSSSMGVGLPTTTLDEMYVWHPEIIKAFRDRLIEQLKDNGPRWVAEKKVALEKLASHALGTGHLPTEEEVEKTAIVAMAGSVDIYDDAAFKPYIAYTLQLLPEFSHIVLPKTGIEPNTIQKLMAVKQAAKDFISKRFEKYPEADIHVYQFNHSVAKLNVKSTRIDLLSGINSMFPNGGTYIFGAISKVLELFIAEPSKVGMHHIVLITDGEDASASKIETVLLPQLKELNVTLDFIFIRRTNAYSFYTDVVASLERVCRSTGGEYTVVSSQKELETKFIKASERLCLPPAKGV